MTAMQCRSRANTVRVNARDEATLELDDGVEGGADYSGLLAGKQHFHHTQNFHQQNMGQIAGLRRPTSNPLASLAVMCMQTAVPLVSGTMHVGPWRLCL